MKSKIKKTLCFLFVVIIATTHAITATIYVDAAAAPGGDGSQGHPFRTISEAVDALAVINAGDQGGHTISVAHSVYEEAVAFTIDHEGTPAAPNVLLGIGRPIIKAGAGNTAVDMREHITLKGFDITASGRVYLRSNGRIDSCRIYGNNGSYAVELPHSVQNVIITNTLIGFNSSDAIRPGYTAQMEIANCTIIGNVNGYTQQDAGSSNDGLLIYNCVFIANRHFGILRTRTEMTLRNNLFYGNYFAPYAQGRTTPVTELSYTGEDINALREENSGNIVANPGYVSLEQAGIGASLETLTFNPLQVYEHSPLIGAGLNGSDIGIHGLDATTPVSIYAYYVCTTGDNNRTKEEARNPATPWQTIQHAADNMIAGNTTIVKAGVYTETVTLTNTAVEEYPVRFIAEPGAILDANGANGFDLVCGSGIIIEGFEIKNHDRGVNLNGALECQLRNVTIHSGIRGVHSGAGAQKIFNAKIYGNTVGVYSERIHATVTVMNSDIHDNTRGLETPSSGTPVRGIPNFRMGNCNIYNNTSRGLEIGRYTFAVLHNCNLANNNIAVRAAGHLTTGITLANCNVTDNNTGVQITDDRADVFFFYSNFHNNGVHYDRAGMLFHDVDAINSFSENFANNISVDPKFRNAAAGYFKLAPDSECIDAGDTHTHLATDYYGKPRLYGPALDIGIYEMQGPGTIFRLW